MNKNFLLVSTMLVACSTYCMNQTTKKAKTKETTDHPTYKTESFPAWKWEVDHAIHTGDTETFAALVKKHNITDQTFISSLPGLALIALGPVRTRVAMATILLDNSADVDQTSPDPIAGSTTGLGWACIEGDERFAQFLIARGAKIQRPHDTKRHPLTLALKYHPTNVSLIKTVMKAAHNQQTLPAVIQNTHDYFSNYRLSKNDNHLSKDEREHRNEIRQQLGLLKNYQHEIENSHDTRSTNEATNR